MHTKEENYGCFFPFNNCFCLQSFFAERFFTLFDSDQSGSIECEELMVGLRKLTKGTPTEKLKFLFDVYDVDGKN